MSRINLSYTGEEKSACGVGFIASRNGVYANEHLKSGLHALKCVEHRGACGADGVTGDGAGIMTNGTVVILGGTSNNIGAGMTGGELFLFEDPGSKVNKEYIDAVKLSTQDEHKLKSILEDYHKETNSTKTGYILSDWEHVKEQFKKYIPVSLIDEEIETEKALVEK